MSVISRWSYANVATVRPYVSSDKLNGGALYGDPYEIACTWTAVKEQRRDDRGQEFTAAYTVWTEDDRPGYLDMVTLAGETREYQLRSRTAFDMSPFMDTPDYELGLA